MAKAKTMTNRERGLLYLDKLTKAGLVRIRKPLGKKRNNPNTSHLLRVEFTPNVTGQHFSLHADYKDFKAAMIYLNGDWHCSTVANRPRENHDIFHYDPNDLND